MNTDLQVDVVICSIAINLPILSLIAVLTVISLDRVWLFWKDRPPSKVNKPLFVAFPISISSFLLICNFMKSSWSLLCFVSDFTSSVWIRMIDFKFLISNSGCAELICSRLYLSLISLFLILLILLLVNVLNSLKERYLSCSFPQRELIYFLIE